MHLDTKHLTYKFHDVDLLLTNQCNLRCPYCDSCLNYEVCNTKSDIDFSILQRLQDALAEADLISISGGEPGLIDKDMLIQTISYLQSFEAPLYLYTNGLFVEKHPDLCTFFNKIVIHIAPEPTKDRIEYYKSLLSHLTHVNYSFRLVLHKHNLELLIEFIKKYHILFKPLEIVPFVSDVKHLRDKFSLSTEDIKEFKLHIPNDINLMYVDNVVQKHNFNDHIQQCVNKVCFHRYSNCVIDFVYRKILLCCWLDPQLSISFDSITHTNDIIQYASKAYDPLLCKHCSHFEPKILQTREFLRCLSNGN